MAHCLTDRHSDRTGRLPPAGISHTRLVPGGAGDSASGRRDAAPQRHAPTGGNRATHSRPSHSDLDTIRINFYFIPVRDIT